MSASRARGVDLVKNCLSRIGCLTLILAVVAAGWWFRDDIAGWWNRLEITASSQPSEDLARRAEEELGRLAEAGGAAGLELSQAEIQSLLTYRAEPLLPAGVSELLVELRDSTLLVSARVDPRELDGLASPELVERLLSDSARVVVELAPGVLQPGVATIEVVTLQAGSVVVPSMMIPWILGSLDLPGVETTGKLLLVPLPARVERFEVEGGELIVGIDRGDGD